MSLELTARLTLSSCVSQLTDFYTTAILETIIEHGMQEMFIRMCDASGELYPYTIGLIPDGDKVAFFQPSSLAYCVMLKSDDDGDSYGMPLFTGRIQKANLTTQNLYKCALHICGDYIKFNEKGL